MSVRSSPNGRPPVPVERPRGHELPQIILEGVLRRSLRADIITFKCRLLGLVELSFIVTVPEEGTTRAPVYVRFFIDRSQEDRPGSRVIE